MKALTRRIGRLEHQLGADENSPRILLIVSGAGCRPALDQDKCIQILRECDFLPTGRVGLVHLYKIPDGLNAEQTERFLRENGAEICGSRSAQSHGGPAGAAAQANQRR